jgi:hypothetical protein
LGGKDESFIARSSLFCCVDSKGDLADPVKLELLITDFTERLDILRPLYAVVPSNTVDSNTKIIV